MSTTQDGRILSITTPLGKDYLLLQKMSAYEGLSELFHIDVLLLHAEDEHTGFKAEVVDPKKILGQSVTIKIKTTDTDETTRYFNGIVNTFSQGNRDRNYSYYNATIVPKLWVSTQNTESRIFQHISVQDIIKKILGEWGVEFEWKCQGSFNERNFCVQYYETDFDFISRLMEEEGIYYYFAHSDGSHKMIIGNTPQGHEKCPSKDTLPFLFDATGRGSDPVAQVMQWLVDYKLQTGKVTLWDHKFELPKTNLEATLPTKFEVAGNKDMEFYEYQGGHSRKYDGIDKSGGDRAADLQKIRPDGTNMAKYRMEMYDAQYQIVNGVSDCCSLTAGHRFDLKNHPTASYNKSWVLTSVSHVAEQSQAYDSMPDAAATPYRATFSCIPHQDAPYRPPLNTPKPVVRGSQTAMVVGPPGEEIFTDKYGRVKVQFHWDREGESNSNSSCWIRVGTHWAGKKWGTIFIPRIGMEVIVDFLEGNPDQPIITGCVYNAETMPPYTLPDEKTKMTIKSDSTPGGDGFNEFRFEDKKGEEQIFIHGQKDVDFRNKNDRREWVGNDHDFIVIKDRREKIGGDEHHTVDRHKHDKIGGDHHLKITGKEAIEIGGSLSMKVKSNTGIEVSGNLSEEATGSVYLKGQTVVIEGTTALTLKVGGSSVNINPGGVQIIGSPLVMINSGGAPVPGIPGMLVPPTDATKPEEADDDKPGSKINLEKRSKARKEKRYMPSAGGAGGSSSDKKDDKKEKTSWIKIKLVNEANEPCPGEAYKVTLPDGSVATGTLDENGEAEIKGFDPGQCKVTFPNLDEKAWE